MAMPTPLQVELGLIANRLEIAAMAAGSFMESTDKAHAKATLSLVMMEIKDSIQELARNVDKYTKPQSEVTFL